jgi:hypothetical protein
MTNPYFNWELVNQQKQLDRMVYDLDQIANRPIPQPQVTYVMPQPKHHHVGQLLAAGIGIAILLALASSRAGRFLIIAAVIAVVALCWVQADFVNKAQRAEAEHQRAEQLATAAVQPTPVLTPAPRAELVPSRRTQEAYKRAMIQGDPRQWTSEPPQLITPNYSNY